MLLESDSVRDWLEYNVGSKGITDISALLVRFDRFTRVSNRNDQADGIVRELPEEPTPPTQSKSISVYTDGSCSGNPGPGGWGAAFFVGDDEVYALYGSSDGRTTNNQMELKAAIEGLKNAASYEFVEIVTDSTYVRDGITKWIKGWKSRNWKTATKTPVKNKELWIELDNETNRKGITWSWVKGHSGDPRNERADQLATRGTEEAKTKC